MKTKLFLLTALVFVTFKSNAQNYLISFAGTGAATKVDSVKVENLTHAATVKLGAGDVLQLMVNAGINDISIDDESIQVSPNPMQGQAEISFYAKESGAAELSIYDLSGREILKINDNLSQGIQKYQLTGLSEGMYFINISGENYFYTTKLISLNTTTSEAKIKYVERLVVNENQETVACKSKSTKATINMAYVTGDNLRFTGYSCNTNPVVVNNIPTDSKTITFTFVEITLSIGDSYQGGLIAYILQPTDPGYVSCETHGLIAAPSNQSTGIGIQWSNSNTTTGATATAIGTGSANTNTIVASEGAGNYAAKLCADLVLGGYSDWHLPSKSELNKLYLNKGLIGAAYTVIFWSSSEYDNNYAWGQDFTNGNQYYYGKPTTLNVRAVRSF